MERGGHGCRIELRRAAGHDTRLGGAGGALEKGGGGVYGEGSAVFGVERSFTGLQIRVIDFLSAVAW